MYRNVIYDAKNECCRLFTWDDDGERLDVEVSFNPYIYYEAKGKTDGISIFNTTVKKRTFKTQYDKYRFVKESGIKRVFENIGSEQQFLIEQFWQKNEEVEFTQHPLKTLFIDIETYSPGKFPDVNNPQDPINVITVYDSLKERFVTWGTKEFNGTIKNGTYYHCRDEVELLRKFLTYVRSDYPDIISGWNSEFFDLPYTIMRMGKLLGEDEYKALSPVGDVYSRQVTGIYGQERTRWYIKGVSCLDYLDIYKKFSMGLRENYKLDTIASFELGEKKVDYGNMNLSSLADEDWTTFVEYNVQDVNLLVKMEDKLQYLKLLRMLAYVGLCPLEAAMGTLGIITGASIIQARKDGFVIPTFVKDLSRAGKYEGAYVGEPERGFQKSIVSFDANSLYPNVMISLNLSPETKVGNIIEKTDKDVTIKHVNGKTFKLSNTKFLEFVKQEEIAISRAKVLFTQKTKGIMPKIVDRLYSQRVEFKKELDKARRLYAKAKKSDSNWRELKNNVDTWWVKQYTVKILINSIYGYFGNKYAPLGDADIARSITLTGQSIVKQANKILTQYFRDRIGNDELPQHDVVKYNDTDSIYISIDPILNNISKELTNDDGNISADTYTLVEDIEKHLNTEIDTYVRKSLNSHDPRFVFSRECIADVGLFLQKKRYVLHLLDDEGIPVDKFKYTGVEVVRTTLPAPVKPYVKKIIETILTTQDLGKANTVLNETYEKFKSLPIEDIAFVMGCKEYDKWAVKCNEFVTCKSMPIHVKSSYYYNKLLDKYNLANTHEKIHSGDKVRYFYVEKPNRFGINTVGYKDYYPKEFNNIFTPDIELMFDKIVFSIVERFYDAVGWQARKPGMAVRTDLFQLLGV